MHNETCASMFFCGPCILVPLRTKIRTERNIKVNSRSLKINFIIF